MTDFEYDNLPVDLPVVNLPAESFNDTLAAITQAAESGKVVAQESRGSYVYERNGSLSFDALGHPRNTSYASGSDDVILQVTVRVRNPKSAPEALSLVAALAERTERQVIEAKIAETEAEILAAEVEEERAKAAASSKQKELDALRARLK